MNSRLVEEYTVFPGESIPCNQQFIDQIPMPNSVPEEHALNDDSAPVILSFDVEEHHQIEAASGLKIDSGLKTHYGIRLETSTRRLLEILAERNIKATFFIVGEIARHNPSLVRKIFEFGHEVASHSWDHRRIHNLTPSTFAEDVRCSKDALEQITGQPVFGYRAPTFSIVRKTSWAIDVLAEQGILYDSSIFPVRHDRYGVPKAPRVPFLAQGHEHSLLEFPPATLRLFWMNFPVGGGGYFRLLPLFLLKMGMRQLWKKSFPRVATLYFHPWEFDPEQARLPLGRLNGFRTYVGLMQSENKLHRLLGNHSYLTAIDVARQLHNSNEKLQSYSIGS